VSVLGNPEYTTQTSVHAAFAGGIDFFIPVIDRVAIRLNGEYIGLVEMANGKSSWTHLALWQTGVALRF
jgi:hypothetical protein